MTAPVFPKKEEDKQEDSENKPGTWEELQKDERFEFGELFARHAFYLSARDLDTLFKHGWEMFLADDRVQYFRKTSDKSTF